MHTPLTEQTRNVLSRDAFMRTKPGVRLVNCARGGLVDEQAVADLIRDGHIAGAAFDVFAIEPARESPLFALDEVVVTPHLGASTSEAQENVALQVAEQIADYLATGAIVNALNMPAVTAEEAPLTTVAYGVGFAERDWIRGSVEVTRRNLFGMDRSVSTFARVSGATSRMSASASAWARL